MRSTRDRQAAILEAQAKIERRPVYLDTETTGTDRRDEIVDICIVDHDGAVLIDTLVKPTIRIPPGASRVHGITDQMVANAPTWQEIWPQVGAILADRHIGIYNADFDLRMLAQSNRKYGIRWRAPHKQVFCIMKLYARFYGQWNPRYGSYKWQTLERAGRQCGIPLPNSHRARDDALLARAILHFMAAAGS